MALNFFIVHLLLLDLGGDVGATAATAAATAGGGGTFFFDFFVLGGDGGGDGATVAVGSLFEVPLLLEKGLEKLNLDPIDANGDAVVAGAGLLCDLLLPLPLLFFAVVVPPSPPPFPKLNFIICSI